MKIFASLFILVNIFTLATRNNQIYDDHHKIRNKYIKYVNEIFAECKKVVWQRYGLRCIGSGGGMPYDVESVSLTFYQEEDFSSFEEARKLEIELIELLNKKINQHEKIRPYLREYPFPISRTRVAISVENKELKQNLPSNKIVYIFQAKNKLFYEGFDGLRLVDLHEETYEEALKANEKYLEKLKKEKSI